jgi:transcriptional regulator with XRE-family HTH domain
MPRPASKAHVLRTTRHLLGLSQVALAKHVGLSPDTIKRIENHSLSMSEDVAARISGYTGVDEGQLLQNSRPSEPLNIWQEPFSEAWFKEVYTAEVSKESVSFWLRCLDFTVRRVVDTCASEKPRAVHSLIAAFFSSVGKISDEYKLRPKAQHLLLEFIERNWEDPLFREEMSASSPWARHFHFSQGAPARAAGEIKEAKSAKRPKRQPL